MLIVTGKCNVPTYTEISFCLWSTDLKEKLEEKTIDFNQAAQTDLFTDWIARFGPMFFLQYETGFKQVGRVEA